MIGEGNGNPLQRSCLENPRDRGAWWAAVYGVAQSRTRLKRLSNSSNRLNTSAKQSASSSVLSSVPCNGRQAHKSILNRQTEKCYSSDIRIPSCQEGPNPLKVPESQEYRILGSLVFPSLKIHVSLF